MNTGFILRFQEPCVSPCDGTIHSGTKTETAAKSEAADSDPDRVSYNAVGASAVYMGTMTKTAVQAEQADSDRDYSFIGLSSEPPANVLCGTSTCTMVAAEAADRDPGRNHLRILPGCSSF